MEPISQSKPAVKKVRQSNFELLRLISIMLIASMHAMGCLFKTDSMVNREIIVFINSFANVGVTLFVFISGYFGIHFRKSRLIEIVCIVWFYSFALFLTEHFLLHVQIAPRLLIPYFIPILCKKFWFITCYVVLYCMSPFINKFCDSLSKQEWHRLLSVYGGFFVIAPTVLVFYEIENDLGKGFLNMLFMYLVGDYLRKYGFPRMITKHPVSIALSMGLLIFILNSVLTVLSGNVILRFARDNSLLILIESVCFFYLFSKWKFASHTVNVLAGYVFGIYLCHGILLKVFNSFYATYMNDMMLWPRLFSLLIAIFMGCIFIDAIRGSLFSLALRLVHKRS